jgi:hypothetical protein
MCLFFFITKIILKWIIPLLFGGDIYRQHGTTFSRLAWVGIVIEYILSLSLTKVTYQPVIELYPLHYSLKSFLARDNSYAILWLEWKHWKVTVALYRLALKASKSVTSQAILSQQYTWHAPDNLQQIYTKKNVSAP